MTPCNIVGNDITGYRINLGAIDYGGLGSGTQPATPTPTSRAVADKLNPPDTETLQLRYSLALANLKLAAINYSRSQDYSTETQLVGCATIATLAHDNLNIAEGRTPSSHQFSTSSLH